MISGGEGFAEGVFKIAFFFLKKKTGLTIAFAAKLRISFIARGALFLNETPCTYSKPRDLVSPIISLPSKIPSFLPSPATSRSLEREKEGDTGGRKAEGHIMCGLHQTNLKHLECARCVLGV